MNRQTMLWTLVVFFGASLTFGLLNQATEGESAGLRVAVQVGALLAIVALIVLVLRILRRG